jgi:hypothetical protein
MVCGGVWCCVEWFGGWCGVVRCEVVNCGEAIKADAKRFPYVDSPFLVGLSWFASPDPAGVRL